MKKHLFILALSAGLIACGGSEKAPESSSTPEAQTETATPVVAAEDTITVSQALAKYEESVKKIIPALIKMQKGDTKAIKEYQSLNKEINNHVSVLTKKASEMTEKEAKKYKEIADKLYKATNPNAPGDKK